MAPRKHEACTVDGCDREHYARGFCNPHYQRVKNFGDPRADVPLQRRSSVPCEVEGCPRRRVTRTLCAMHEHRRRVHGDALAAQPSGALPRGKRLREGERRPTSDGYVKAWFPGHPNAHASGWVLEHRKVMSDMLGRPLLPDEVPHHKNGVRTDNSPGNLELCIKRHPPGQRVADLLPWAREIVERYDGVLLA